MSTAVATETPSTTFAIITSTFGEFNIEVITAAGRSVVKNSYGEPRNYSTRSSARKAITRLRRSL